MKVDLLFLLGHTQRMTLVIKINKAALTFTCVMNGHVVNNFSLLRGLYLAASSV